MLREMAAAVAKHPWLRKAAVSTPVVRGLAWRFVAGEDLDAGVAALHALRARGILGTLNHVGTHVREEAEARAAAEAAVAAIDRLRAEGLEPNLSLKLTQIGLDVDEGLCRALLGRVVGRAAAAGGFVRIDMEESPYVERTLRLFEEARDRHGAAAVGAVLQSYLRGRNGDLDRLASGRSRIRLVKGGYWEPSDVAWRTRAAIDGAFLSDLQRLIGRSPRPAIATHDRRAVAVARRVAAEAGLAPADLEFQMLYGVAEDLQGQLVREGYPVRCYVPYGSGWYEYFLGCVRRLPGGALRRLRERLGPHPH